MRMRDLANGFLVTMFMFLALTGCGGGSDGGTSTPTTPTETVTSRFVSDVTAVVVNGEVSFTDKSVNALSVKYTFSDDGSVSTERDPKHIFKKVGAWGVDHAAFGNNGKIGTSQLIIVVTETPVVALPPVASFTITGGLTTGYAPFSISATSTSTEADSLVWNFGDGSPPETTQGIVHVYTKPGTYPLSLTAIGKGGTNSKSTTIVVKSSVVTPPPTSPIINGTEADGVSRMTDGSNLFIVTIRSQNVYLTKFDAQNNLLWEKPVLVTSYWDECEGAVYMNGFIYLICVQDSTLYAGMSRGIILFEKIDAVTGNKIKESVISNDGTPKGLVADQSIEALYSYYGNSAGIGFEIKIDPSTGTILNGAEEQSMELLGITVVGADGIYAVGTIMEAGTRNRIYVVKFSKDLTTRLWTSQYRNFSDSSDIDYARSAEMSAGNLIVRGELDSLSNPRPVTLKFNSVTGVITVL